jgi:hypothetical protein
MHVVFTHDLSGAERLYVNGTEISQQTQAGDFSNWETNFQLALANEITGTRAWMGDYYLVAIYSRALTPDDVQQNWKAGPDS